MRQKHSKKGEREGEEERGGGRGREEGMEREGEGGREKEGERGEREKREKQRERENKLGSQSPGGIPHDSSYPPPVSTSNSTTRWERSFQHTNFWDGDLRSNHRGWRHDSVFKSHRRLFWRTQVRFLAPTW